MRLQHVGLGGRSQNAELLLLGVEKLTTQFFYIYFKVPLQEIMSSRTSYRKYDVVYHLLRSRLKQVTIDKN